LIRWTTEEGIVAALRRIIRNVDLHSRRLEEGFGLTGPQLAVVQAAGQAGQAPIGMLSRAVHLSQATVTGILDRLEKRRLIARRRSGRDRREVQVSLTSEGRRMLESAPSLLQDRFREELARLQEWEQTMMLAILQRVAEMMESEAASTLPTRPERLQGPNAGAQTSAGPDGRKTPLHVAVRGEQRRTTSSKWGSNMNAQTSLAAARVTKAANGLEVALPVPDKSLPQDAEWCVVRVGDEWRRVRFHDYDELYSVPGLYERVIYDILECDSPRVICRLLGRQLAADGVSPSGLRVLDLGAGNGIVAEELGSLRAKFMVGVDIIDEAAEAAQRDRPGLYDNYHVIDMTRLSRSEQQELEAYRFNCLTCVAALGFGDIPIEAFTQAYNLIEPDGWIAFNIKDAFLGTKDQSGFADLIDSVIESGVLEVRCKERYAHRLGTDREPLYYYGIVGHKRADIPTA
jgi:DNA-binding MarR family transcriptional regulator/2-polyprenyl-3-methyl-5-hydroxy-6-metoxy-1,4-benzoquinol methylase